MAPVAPAVVGPSGDRGHGPRLRAGHRRFGIGGRNAGEISRFRKPTRAGMNISWGPCRGAAGGQHDPVACLGAMLPARRVWKFGRGNTGGCGLVGPPRPPWDPSQGRRVSETPRRPFCQTGGSSGAQASRRKASRTPGLHGNDGWAAAGLLCGRGTFSRLGLQDP